MWNIKEILTLSFFSINFWGIIFCRRKYYFISFPSILCVCFSLLPLCSWKMPSSVHRKKSRCFDELYAHFVFCIIQIEGKKRKEWDENLVKFTSAHHTYRDEGNPCPISPYLISKVAREKWDLKRKKELIIFFWRPCSPHSLSVHSVCVSCVCVFI